MGRRPQAMAAEEAGANTRHVELGQQPRAPQPSSRLTRHQLFADPTRARIIISTFAFVFVAAVVTMVVLLQTQSFQTLPVPAPPPLPPRGRPCPWSIPCKRSTNVVCVARPLRCYQSRPIFIDLVPAVMRWLTAARSSAGALWAQARAAMSCTSASTAHGPCTRCESKPKRC